MINTTMLGAVAAVTTIIGMASLSAAIRESGVPAPEKNIEAAHIPNFLCGCGNQGIILWIDAAPAAGIPVFLFIFSLCMPRTFHLTLWQRNAASFSIGCYIFL
jgi:hypothetical protein